jgi:primosomal protein N' (replication factor Y)
MFIFAVTMGCRTYISVILPLKLEWEPCYFIPEELLPAEKGIGQDGVGRRVKVNFSGKEYVGVISATGISPKTEISRIKAIKAFEEGLGDILPQEIELWRQLADYYLCTVGEVYKAAYPFGKIDLEESRAAAKQKAEERKAKEREAQMARISRIEERIAKKRELLAKARKESTRETYSKDIERLERESAFFRATLEPVWKHNDSGSTADQAPLTPTLTPAQSDAANKIRSSFAKGKPVLLNGVTGSGKTEIYISLALEAMKQGRNILYLVPEISLSRQLEERLEKYFGNSLMTFHSRDSCKQTQDC